MVSMIYLPLIEVIDGSPYSGIGCGIGLDLQIILKNSQMKGDDYRESY